MIKFLILSTVLVSTVFSWDTTYQGKPGTTTTVAAIKLAEAKASLSKPVTRNTKNVLGTADGGF